MSLSEQVKQYLPGALHTDESNLFCTTCNLTTNYAKKKAIDQLLKNKKHHQGLRWTGEAADSRFVLFVLQGKSNTTNMKVFLAVTVCLPDLHYSPVVHTVRCAPL